MTAKTAATALATLALVATTACSHTTTITARPAGTSISVDGEQLGTDQVTTDIDNGMGGTYTVRAEAEGREALEVAVSREQLAWGPLGAAIGGCLVGGCIGGFLGLASAQFFIVTSPCGAVLLGAPWLAFLMAMNTGPDALVLDLDARTVTATPETTIEVLEGSEAAPSTPTPPSTPTTPRPDDPVGPGTEDPAVAPFDY